MSRRNAILVRRAPVPVLRVRSASGAEPHLVTAQPADDRLVCDCTAARFGSRCTHVAIARRSLDRRRREGTL